MSDSQRTVTSFHLLHRWGRWQPAITSKRGVPWQVRRCVICGREQYKEAFA